MGKGLGRALASGAAGALALNVAHETARHFISEAPRVQRVAMRAIARPLRRLGRKPPWAGSRQRGCTGRSCHAGPVLAMMAAS